MRSLIAALLLTVAGAVPAAAETYSWIDEQGTYNFTEDYSQVPKKYRKKVQRRSDIPDVPAASGPATAPAAAESTDKARKQAPANPAATGGAPDPQQLFGGKTEEAWRKEFAAQEAELTALEQRMAAIADQVKSPKARLNTSDIESLKREHQAANDQYKQKYKVYSDLLESARRAGLTITMKK